MFSEEFYFILWQSLILCIFHVKVTIKINKYMLATTFYRFESASLCLVLLYFRFKSTSAEEFLRYSILAFFQHFPIDFQKRKSEEC